MIVLYLNTNPRNSLADAAGYATHMAKTIRGFEAAGHRVVRLLAAEDPGAERARNTYRGMRRRVPEGLARAARDAWEMAHDRTFFRSKIAEAAAARPDFIYERANAFHASGLRMARRLGVPLVLEINDPLRDSVSMRFSVLKPLAVLREDALMRGADLVVVGSEALRAYYVRRGFDAEKLLVIYPTADEAIFSPAIDGAPVRTLYGLSGAAVAGFVGSMAPWHRVDLFCEALRRLAGRGVAGMLVGEMRSGGPHGAEAAAGMVVTGRVPHDEVPHHIAAMDVCVIANATWYGSPTKLFEYAAMGKAVVAPRFPPIEEVIEDGRTGLLFSPGSVAELAAALQRLVEDPGLRLRLGGALRRRVTTEFSWEENTRRVIEAITRRVPRRRFRSAA